MSQMICVYCASSDQVDPDHFQLARSLGKEIAEAGWQLIFGGGSVGLMGEVAKAAAAHDGHVTGVIPRFMAEKEIAYREADDLILVDNMRQRKEILEQRADAFVVLPGGIGTLEELLEILTLKVLRQHHKPIVIMNPQGFYDPLIELFEHLVDHRFAKPRLMESFQLMATARDARAYLGESLGEVSGRSV